jgi:hypothetical protein
MKLWQKIAVFTLVPVLIVGAYLFYVFHSRKVADEAASKPAEAKPVSQDDLAVMKQYYFATFDQAKQLEGTTVWIKAGFSLPYYPFAGGKVDFAKRVGVLPSAEKLSISKLVKAAAPAKEDDRIPHGTKQYFAVFTLSGPEGKTGTFATPIGAVQGDDEKIYTDLMFFYDDPKTIYDNWPKSVWDAVAVHEPKVGMSELQTQMAVGTVQESDSQSIGNRTVTYDAGGKSWTVTFSKGVATQVKAG